MLEQNTASSESEVPPVGQCQSYRPGHQSHWIMAKKYRSAPSKSAIVLAVQGNEITLRVGQEVMTWQHHEPDRLMAALRHLPRSVRIPEGCTAILFDRGGSTHWFYCAPGEMENCVLDDS